MAASSGQKLEPDKASSASQKVDNPEISIATTPQEAIGQNVYCPTRPTLKVTLLGSEWNSSAGGLSTLNRELAIHLSKHPKVEVSLLVPEGACKDVEKRAAKSYGITVVDAKERPGYDHLDWLSFPPEDLKMDIVVGHGVKLGRQGQVIRDSSRFHNCKWVQVVHTAPEDLSKYKHYSDPISKGERKHQVEVDLCKLANLVVPVGPRLDEFYSSYLRRCKKDQDVFPITPGLFDREFGDLEQAPNENADFKVLIFGRGDDEDFELKGYNIAAEAFTDQRLKQKPYHLIFVGAPEGKQEEVRQKLLRCGIAEEQLTVRKFIQSRDRMKDLLCEADLGIMPSKSEGFGLVALEALSAGLPILVGRKSGFAKALENVSIGHSCIVGSDDPAKWAEAIEAVRVGHGMWLKEIKTLRASYEKKFSWKQQCEALVERMWGLVHGPSSEKDNIPKVDSPAEQQLVAEAHDADCRTSEQQPLLLNEEKRASGTNNGAASSLSNKSQSLQNWCQPSISGSSFIPGTVIKHSYQDLSDEQQEIVHETLQRQIQVYMKHHKLSTHDGVGGLIEHIKETHHLALKSVGVSSLVIEVQCPTLESLESLWNDYCSGHLNKVAERYLVTNEIKRKLNLETVRLKTTIEEENYMVCKMAFMEKSWEAGSTDFSTEHSEPDQGGNARWTDTSFDFPKDEMATVEKHKLESPAVVMSKKKGKILLEDVKGSTVKSDVSKLGSPAVVMSKKKGKTMLEDVKGSTMKSDFPKASRALLIGALLIGQYETVKMLLESGEDVEQKDSDGITPLQLSVMWGHENLVKLLLEHNADANIQDSLGYTPLHWSVMNFNENLAKLLLEYNADVNIKDRHRETPLHLSVTRGHENLVKLLLEHNADVNIQDWDGYTPLHLSVRHGYENLAKLLLEYNADVNIKDRHGETPLHLSVTRGHENLVKLLLEHNADVNIQYWDGDTLLHWSVRHGDENLVKLLLEHNADVNIPNNAGDTPLQLVRYSHKSHSEITDLLVKYGARYVDSRGAERFAPQYTKSIRSKMASSQIRDEEEIDRDYTVAKDT